MATLPSNQNQIPDRSIMDYYNRQRYLGQQFIYGLNGYSSGATAETNVLLIQNPIANASASASFPGRQTIGLFLDFRRLACVTASETAVLKFYSNPIFSAAGTSETPVNCRPAYSNVSMMAISQAPTTSAKGTFLDSLESGAYVPSESRLLYILDPGQSMLVTVTSGSSSTSFNTAFSWYEI